MFLAGVHWAYFAARDRGRVSADHGRLPVARDAHGNSSRIISTARIDTFLDPSTIRWAPGITSPNPRSPWVRGLDRARLYARDAIRLNFLPEKHTDFIFTTSGRRIRVHRGVSLLGLYALIIVFCVASALANRDRFSSLLILGIALNFFLFFAVNMSMVMGMAPVVGVPLPLVSYGGSAMLVLMIAFGLVQSAHVHRPR